MKSQFCIYGLVDPRTGEVFYVGRTRWNLFSRLGRHLEETWATNTTKCIYLQEMESVGVTPSIVKLRDVKLGEDPRRIEFQVMREVGEEKLTNEILPDGISDNLRQRLRDCQNRELHSLNQRIIQNDPKIVERKSEAMKTSWVHKSNSQKEAINRKIRATLNSRTPTQKREHIRRTLLGMLKTRPDLEVSIRERLEEFESG